MKSRAIKGRKGKMHAIMGSKSMAPEKRKSVTEVEGTEEEKKSLLIRGIRGQHVCVCVCMYVYAIGCRRCVHVTFGVIPVCLRLS